MLTANLFVSLIFYIRDVRGLCSGRRDLLQHMSNGEWESKMTGLCSVGLGGCEGTWWERSTLALGYEVHRSKLANMQLSSKMC